MNQEDVAMKYLMKELDTVRDEHGVAAATFIENTLATRGFFEELGRVFDEGDDKAKTYEEVRQLFIRYSTMSIKRFCLVSDFDNDMVQLLMNKVDGMVDYIDSLEDPEHTNVH